MPADLARLRLALGEAPLTVERLRNEVSRQTRFVIFDTAGELLIEDRYQVVAAWIAGYRYARRLGGRS
jgi:hypothetical protein